MKRLSAVGALVLLSGCGSPSAVGANSADSVTTTAVGNVVATIPSPTPTPDAATGNGADAPTNDAGSTSNAAAASNAM
ncbi:MAG: hypothetical protein V4459_13455 [Pseudomonadota bacterium]